MFLYLWILFVVVISATPPLQQTNNQQTPEQTLRAFSTALKTGDVDLATSFLNSDLVVYESGSFTLSLFLSFSVVFIFSIFSVFLFFFLVRPCRGGSGCVCK